jgi:hypothetical protein
MKAIKIKNAEYADMTKLLNRAGLVQGNQAYPQNIFVSKKTYKKITQAISKQYRKEYPGIYAKKLQVSVGMYLLNLGPVVVDTGIELGYALVLPIAEDISQESP